MIDCETNEELFITLAALRDDTPINSYYWFNDKLVMCYSIFDLNINQSITYRFQSVDNPKICFPSNIDNMRKATVEEIIKHFKDKMIMEKQIFNIMQGWQCPICKRVYSPFTQMCLHCSNKEVETITLPNTRGLPQEQKSNFRNQTTI